MLAMFLISLVAGIVDLGRGIFTAVAIDDAAAEGAQYAAFTESVMTAQIADRVAVSVSEPTIDPAAVSVSCVAVSRSGQQASRVTVTATHQVDLITPFIEDMFGESIVLTRTAVAERFFPDCPTEP